MKTLKNTAKKGYFTIGKFYFILFLLVVASCNTKTEPTINIPDDLEEYYEFQGFDLGEYGIPATIMLPDETANIGASTKPEVEHLESDFYWNIYVGQNFHLYIEDYGDNADLVQAQKKKLENTQFYDVNYIVDEPDLIVYEVTLKVRGHEKASESVGVKHVSYHVYGEHVINGVHYELRSRDEGFERPIINLMAKSIRSFKERKK